LIRTGIGEDTNVIDLRPSGLQNVTKLNNIKAFFLSTFCQAGRSHAMYFSAMQTVRPCGAWAIFGRRHRQVQRSLEQYERFAARAGGKAGVWLHGGEARRRFAAEQLNASDATPSGNTTKATL